MKLLPFLLAGSYTFILVSLPQKAEALPFRRDCASIQNYFNSLRWSTPTRFSGFENKPVSTTVINVREGASCENGYITETSPMGTRVCLGYIEYYVQLNGRKYNSWSPRNDSSCRWK